MTSMDAMRAQIFAHTQTPTHALASAEMTEITEASLGTMYIHGTKYMVWFNTIYAKHMERDNGAS